MEDRHLATMIAQNCRKFSTRIAMRYKNGEDWQEISYADLGTKIQCIAAALVKMGVQAGDRVGIFAQNCAEWAIADFGILSVDAVTVPIYATNTASQAAYIVRDAGLEIIFVGDEEQYRKVREFADNDTPLRHIIMFETPSAPVQDGDRTGTFQALLTQDPPAQDLEKLAAKRPADTSRHLASIIYTSGTTGDPKGVMLSHGNFFHQIDAVNANFKVTPDDRSMCFLPLSHVYERIWSYIVFHQGAQNNYIRNPREVLAYFGDIKPTAMVSVPRLYEKIYAAIMDRIEKAPSKRKRLFAWATGVGRRWANARSSTRGPSVSLILRVPSPLSSPSARRHAGAVPASAPPPRRSESAPGIPRREKCRFPEADIR